MLTVTYPDGALLTYTRDAMGRITAVSAKPSGASSATTLASSIAYEPFGPWTSLTNGNGIVETPGRDAARLSWVVIPAIAYIWPAS